MITTDAMASPLPVDHQPYSVKRHGLNITNCDSEPVQTPGCVQAHGALLVLRLADLCIVQASDNAQTVLGHAVKAILSQPVSAVIGVQGQGQLQALLDKQSSDHNPLYLLSLPAGNDRRNEAGTPDMLDVMAHTIDGVVILEFESTSRMDVVNTDANSYALIKKTVARLQTAVSLQHLCNLAADEIRELSGMDRVMVYKFHEDGHGEVFAESKRLDLKSWLGMHYPAEDIPKPARDVFKKTWIRPIPDMSDELSEMVPLVNPDTGKPLDMTYCSLRGVSIMCTEYYRNMGVGATLTLSIRRDDHLWGLFACNHQAGPKYLPYQVRAACEFLAQVVSLQHNAAEDKEYHAYRLKLESVHQQLVANAVCAGGLTALANNTPSLLDGIDATGAALYHGDRWWCLGKTPNVPQLEKLVQWLNDVKLPSSSQPLYATDRLTRDYSPAAAFTSEASGLLALPFSRTGRDLMLWFKPETMQTVNWGGDPHGKPLVLGPNGPRLTPRVSFELFVESVKERSLPWKQIELEAVAKLRLQLIEMVVERTEQRSSLNADLARSNQELDAFTYVASHDLKEPLRGIHKYAFQLMEDAKLLDDKDRNKLDRMMQLTTRMDSLLDSLLHFSRVGKVDITFETVDLNEVLAEAVEMMGRLGVAQLKLLVPRPLPLTRCNRGWCREILVNLLSNSLKYTDATSKQVEVGSILAGESHPRPGCPKELEGENIYYVADNGIGIQTKDFSQIFKLFKRLHGRDEYGGGSGIGLTIVRKLVEQHGGMVWLDSVQGQGTTFYFTLSGKGSEDRR